ncbi:hypothetical protein AYO40_06100 [Planctomycetaceae bacterium SCGC AG-212-D15]|nr:hypothetical protein AYO40_06100 [Planctomycetaceae bacterium SCGC AG-212-D15]
MGFLIVATAVVVFVLSLTVCLLPVRHRWKGTLLILTGYYACAYTAFGIYKGIVHHPPYSRSIAEAKSRRSFISEARFEPMNVKWQGIDLEFDEVWIEEAMEIKPNVLLLPYEKVGGWYSLCFSLKKEPSEKVLFRVEGHKGGFGSTTGAGWRTYDVNIPHPEVFDLHLYVQKSWQDKERFEVSIRRP